MEGAAGITCDVWYLLVGNDDGASRRIGLDGKFSGKL